MPSIQAEADRQALRRLRDLVREVVRHAHAAWRSGREHARLEASALRLEQGHPELIHANHRDVAVYLVANAVLVAAILIDLLVTMPAVQILLADQLRSMRGVEPLFIWFMPVALISIDVFIGSGVYLAAERRSHLQVLFWGTLALAFVMVPALLVRASRLAATTRVAGDPAFELLNWAVTLLVLVSHAVVAFGGKRAHDAKAYALVVPSHKWLVWQAHRAERREQYERGTAFECFADHDTTRRQFNEQHTATPIPPPQLDGITGGELRRALTEISESTSAPAQPTSPADPAATPVPGTDAAPPAPATAPASVGGTDEENAHLRAVLGRRQRDDDAEV